MNKCQYWKGLYLAALTYLGEDSCWDDDNEIGCEEGPRDCKHCWEEHLRGKLAAEEG